MNELHANGALSDGGGDPLNTPRADVADDEDPRRREAAALDALVGR
jgi:hypothetical protein